MIPFQPALRKDILRAACRVGVRSVVAEQAMRKWEEGGQPVPCTEELKGKPFGVESSGSFACQCLGCVERRCFSYFARLRQHFPAG